MLMNIYQGSHDFRPADSRPRGDEDLRDFRPVVFRPAVSRPVETKIYVTSPRRVSSRGDEDIRDFRPA